MSSRHPDPEGHDADEPQDAPGLVALTELGRDAAKPHTPAELDQGLTALRARLATDLARRSARRRWALVGATAIACAAAALKLASVVHDGASDPPVVVSRIEGGSLLEGGYLSQSRPAGVKVLFSEGTTFELAAGTRGRLRSVTTDGAHLAVEDGTVAVRVTQSHTHRWLVEAGPFLVTVKGTVFSVSWDPSSERFELRLRHGHVVVSGPLANGAIALRGGQRLIVSLPKAETVITEEPSAGDAAPAVPAFPARPAVANDTASRPATALAAASPSLAKSARTRRWAADLASGRWDRILADVDRDGVGTILENAASEDLFALADAARYRRRADLARAALLAQRRRFPHAPRSLDAIFLLGRAEELREQGTPAEARAQAIIWYDEYLARAPTGAYAAEALGRKMILTNEVGGPAQARPIAREYLLRFPTGSYAGSARALQRMP
jgi:hypothetical protein